MTFEWYTSIGSRLKTIQTRPRCKTFLAIFERCSRCQIGFHCHIYVFPNSRGHGNAAIIATLLQSRRVISQFSTLTHRGRNAAVGRSHCRERLNVLFRHTSDQRTTLPDVSPVIGFEWVSHQKQTARVPLEFLAHTESKRCKVDLFGRCGRKCKNMQIKKVEVYSFFVCFLPGTVKARNLIQKPK